MTSGHKINTGTPKSRNILIAPLDWGLGHATRCIPIIKHLQAEGFSVIIASEGKQADLLAQEFPNVELLQLSGYKLSYSETGLGMAWKIFLQLPKILTSVNREKRWLDNLIAHRQVDVVISDCRYGLFHKDVFCVFLTHQLRIRSPFASWTERILQKLNYRFINRFNECWVPDEIHPPGLAGELSHPVKLPDLPVRYIGGLSRFEFPAHNIQKKYDVLFIISGPEPQRSIFENRVLKELLNYKGSAALVRGLPGTSETILMSPVKIVNHLAAEELRTLILESAVVICRSGYTSIMDLIKLRKKTVLIPTPGQTEQEYLGKLLMQQQLCITVSQAEFTLNGALDAVAGFDYADMSRFDMEGFKSKITL